MFCWLSASQPPALEAAAKVSQPVRDSAPDIPWQQIVGTRHRLIHGYDAVDLDLLWSIITTDLPPLAAALQSLLSQIEGS